jgi:hypothetical protein
MGGYYAPYVLALLALLAWRARSGPLAARPLGVMLAMSVVCALLPLSHELRYYLFWMLSLAAFALVLAFSPRFAAPAQDGGATVTRLVVLVALASVTLATGATYVRTTGMRLAELIAPTNVVVDALPAGATLCVAPNYRDAVLYSPLFHSRRDYHVRAVYPGDTQGCATTITPP